MPEKVLQGDEQRELRLIARFVEREVAGLYHHKAVYAGLRGVFLNPDAAALRFGHFFFNAVWAWYTTSMLVTLRALTETSKRGFKALSLVGLLSRVASSSAFKDADREQAQRDLEMIRLEAEAVYVHTSKRVTHRDPELPIATADENEIYRLLDVVSETLDRTVRVVFGTDYQKLIVDVDPWWAENLFSFAWNKPSEFNERLALGSEASLVHENQRRDFTEAGVYSRRPTDDELAIYGVTREEFESMREAQFEDLSQ